MLIPGVPSSLLLTCPFLVFTPALGHLPFPPCPSPPHPTSHGDKARRSVGLGLAEVLPEPAQDAALKAQVWPRRGQKCCQTEAVAPVGTLPLRHRSSCCPRSSLLWRRESRGLATPGRAPGPTGRGTATSRAAEGRLSETATAFVSSSSSLFRSPSPGTLSGPELLVVRDPECNPWTSWVREVPGTFPWP